MTKEEWLLNGAVVPVDVETTAALVAEIHRLIGVVGGMALAQPAQRPWAGLTDEELSILGEKFTHPDEGIDEVDFGMEVQRILKEKNT